MNEGSLSIPAEKVLNEELFIHCLSDFKMTPVRVHDSYVIFIRTDIGFKLALRTLNSAISKAMDLGAL